MTGPGWPRVSILIAGGREAPGTRHTVTSLQAGDYPGEVQILTGGSSENRVSAEAANGHAAEAAGPFLMILPAGTTLDPSCLRRLVSRLQADGGLMAVAPLWLGPDGRALAPNSYLAADRPVRKLLASGEATAIDTPFGIDLDALGSMLLRTRRFFQEGGLATGLDGSPYLNADLARRMSSPDGRVEIETAAVAFSPDQPAGFQRLPAYPLTTVPDRPRPPAGPGPHRRILWVAAHVPDRDRSGADARHIELIEALTGSGNELAGWAEHHGSARLAGATAPPGRWITPPPDARWVLPGSGSPGRWLRQLLSGAPWDVMVIAEPRLAGWVMPMARLLAPDTRIVVDLGAVRFPDAHQSDADPAASVVGPELAVLAGADGVIAATRQDAAVVAAAMPGLPVTAFGAFGREPATDAGPEGHGRLLFIGDLLHRPNLEALDWWIEQVAPQVAVRLGEPASLRVVGSASDVHRASRNHPGRTDIAGWKVDLDVEMNRARLLVVPVTVATGTGGRIATALRRGMPVVATPAAAAVLPDALAGLVHVGEDAAALAEQVGRLMGSDEPWEAARTRIEAAGIPALRAAQLDAFGEWLATVQPTAIDLPDGGASPTPRSRRGRRRRARAS